MADHDGSVCPSYRQLGLRRERHAMQASKANASLLLLLCVTVLRSSSMHMASAQQLCPADATSVTVPNILGYNRDVQAFALEPQTRRLYIVDGRRDRIGIAAPDVLRVVPNFLQGNTTTIQMTSVLQRPGVRMSNDTAVGIRLRDIIMARAPYDPEQRLYLRISSLVFTDTELVIVTEQDVIAVSRAALAADPEGSTVTLSSVFPLPLNRSFRYKWNPTASGSSWLDGTFNWTAAAWSPELSRLYATSYAGSAMRSMGSWPTVNAGTGMAIFSWRRTGASWERAVQHFAAGDDQAFGMSPLRLSYLPPSPGSSDPPRLLVGLLGSADDPTARVIFADLQNDGSIATTRLVAGEPFGDATVATGSWLDGAPAVGARLGYAFRAAVAAQVESGLAIVLSFAYGRDNRVVWPNGTLGTWPERIGVSALSTIVPLRAEAAGATISALLTDIYYDEFGSGLRLDLKLCIPRSTQVGSGPCSPGRVCSLLTPETEPAVAPCPRRLYCSAATVNVFALEDSARFSTAVLCPRGFTCAEGAALPVICPAGSICIENATSSVVIPCPPGMWCPAGTSWASLKFCASVLTNPSILQQDHQCTCKAGVHIEGYDVEYPTNVLSSPLDPLLPRQPAGFPVIGACVCNAGTLCTGGTAAEELCPGGLYCQAGSGVPSGTCAPGYFCPEGSYTSEYCMTLLLDARPRLGQSPSVSDFMPCYAASLAFSDLCSAWTDCNTFAR